VFICCGRLVQDLLIAKRDLAMSKLLKKLSRYDAIIVEDIGYVQQSRQKMEVLFTFQADRYERGSLMITSNLPFSKWQRIFKDPINVAVAIDPLVHHSEIVQLNIESYRMQVAKKNKRKKPDGLAKGSK
jgi:DNA replication protein DnaC